MSEKAEISTSSQSKTDAGDEWTESGSTPPKGNLAPYFGKIVLLFFSLAISMYVAEIVLSFFPEISSQDKSELVAYRARKRGLPVDPRSKSEAIKELRRTGESWFPSVSPTNFVAGKTLTVADTPVMPLGGVANANILYCNESGSYTTYTSDEYGFHNPQNIWQSQSKFENVFIGDSFTNGSCVKQGEGFVDRIRDMNPSTLNLAATGNGPLSEFACIKEYLKDRKLGHVFWVYFEENDLSDLYNKEVNEPILKRYLDEDDFSQGLIANRENINAALIKFVNDELTKDYEKPPPTAGFTKHITFASTKEALFKLKNSFIRVEPAKYDLELFGSILAKAKNAVEKDRGQLVFIYLPEFGRYNGNRTTKGSAAHLKDQVIGMVNSLGIDVIDMDSTFSQLDDPKAVFTFGVHNHYNAGGNLMIAGEISRYLNMHITTGSAP